VQVYLGQATDIGIVRRNKNNQDSIGFDLNQGLFIVADGMGGLEDGEYASKTTVLRIKQLVASAKINYQDRKNALIKAIKTANSEIYQRSIQERKLIGTTVTALLVGPGKYFVAQVGDSRAYLIRNNSITQLTKDHTKVQRMVDNGIITAEEARNHPERSFLERGIGNQYDIDIDVFEGEFRETDTMLLCSDGLWEPVSDKEILEIINNYDNPQDACKKLINLANHYGGPDNVSVVIAQAQGTSRVFKVKRKKINIKKFVVPALTALIILAVFITLLFIVIPIIRDILKPKLKQLVINIYEDTIPLKGVTVKGINIPESNQELKSIILTTNQNNKIDTVYIGETILFSKTGYESVKFDIPNITAKIDTIERKMEKKTEIPIVAPPIPDSEVKAKVEPKKLYSKVDLVLSGFTNKGKKTDICGAEIWIDGRYTNKQVSSTKKGTIFQNYKIGEYKIEFKKDGKIIAYKEINIAGTNPNPVYDANAYWAAPGKPYVRD